VEEEENENRWKEVLNEGGDDDADDDDDVGWKLRDVPETFWGRKRVILSLDKEVLE